MAQSKEANLNESYYGPTIPPAQPVDRTIRAPSLGCEPYRLICALFKIFTTILIVVGIIVLVLWLIFQPHDLKVYVESASLTRFDLAPNSTLYYNLTLDMSVRNPNAKVGVYYEHLEARAFYDGARFGYESFARFHQHRKNTTMLYPSFSGQGIVAGDSVAATYSREKGEGFFYVSVKLYTRVRLKMIVIKSVEYTPEVDCYLRLPAPSNATSVAGGFTRTKCDVETFS